MTIGPAPTADMTMENAKNTKGIILVLPPARRTIFIASVSRVPLALAMLNRKVIPISVTNVFVGNPPMISFPLMAEFSVMTLKGATNVPNTKARAIPSIPVFTLVKYPRAIARTKKNRDINSTLITDKPLFTSVFGLPE